VAAVGEGVAVLHADDGDDLLGLLDFGGCDFAEADVADFSLVLHLFQGTQTFLERGTGVDAVKLVEFDALEFEATEAHFNALNEVAGAANVLGFGGALASDAALGGDDEVGRVRMQGFADEAFGDFRAVGVGGVDKGDAERDGAAEDAAGFVWIAWFAPGAFTDKTHGSVTEALDGEVAGNVEGSAGGSGGSAHDVYAKGQGLGTREQGITSPGRPAAGGRQGTLRALGAYVLMQATLGDAAMTTTAYVNAQAVFYQQYEQARRDEVVGILLALFLGGFGIHHFYLRRTGLGILYACFCWTPFPWVLGFIECFFMPGRVREFNAIQAAGIAAALGISMPAYGQPINVTVNVPPGGNAPAASASAIVQPGTLMACGKCGKTNAAGAKFCSGCGAALQ
jgi:TM2 domain-containing membrane protein YozV